MAAPIALQLYSVREAAGKDYAGTLRKVADAGYVGVEPAGFPGSSLKEAKAIYKALGLQVCSAHMALPVGDARGRVIDEAGELGITRVVSGFGPDQFKTLDDVKRSCEQFNLAADGIADAGLTFGIHNHWWEFSPLAGHGERVYVYMLEELLPEVFFEVDTYWVKTGGADPAAVLKELGPRAPLLHIKDGPCEQGQPMTAAGKGKMDFHAVVEAAGDHVEWMIVELDACATDMLEAVAESQRFLVGEGLAEGR